MVVAIAGSAPFVNDTSGASGISVEVWAQLAQRMQWTYRTAYFEDVSAALMALQAGEVDAVVGPVSITSDRAGHMNFTQPYFQSTLAILSRLQRRSLLQLLAPFFSRRFFFSVVVFVLVLAVVGCLLWLAERRTNPSQFPPAPVAGIGNGMWCAIVTLSTTGYGDVAPRTFWGRFIAGVWMVVSLVGATTLIAGIASTVTLSSMIDRTIQNAEELRGRKVASLPGSTAAEFIQMSGGVVVPVGSIAEATEKLKEAQVDAMVYDRPQLAYFVRSHPETPFALSSAEYDHQGYGFAFPLGFSHLHEVNVALLELEEDGYVDQISSRWLGRRK
jgi:polar amino acid transport system substrate-binding protein